MRWIWLLPLTVACSEYQINKEKEPPEAVDTEVAGVPDLALDATELTAEGVCVTVDRDVTLSSVGDAAVQIQALDLDGDGWELLDTPELPLDLEPGDALTLTLLGTEGEATLTVESDDPDDGLQTVALSASADQDPEITIITPEHADIVEVTELELSVEVADAEDDASDLYVSWTSDVDGLLTDTFAESDGTATLAWTDGLTGGDHTLTATVMDTCGNETSTDVQICQQAGYDVENLDISTWNFEGDANWDSTNGWLELTDTSTYQLGSAFQLTSVSGDNVTIEFQFFTGNGTGADGLALTALDTSRATSYLGSSGGCLGYGYAADCGNLASPLPGWTIEIDTYYNSSVDPTSDDHVSFHFDGDVANPEVWSALPEMEDNGWHTVSIEVVDPHVTVIIDGTTYIDDDVSGTMNFPANVGFSASTGGLTNDHLIDALTVTEYVCEEG